MLWLLLFILANPATYASDSTLEKEVKEFNLEYVNGKTGYVMDNPTWGTRKPDDEALFDRAQGCENTYKQCLSECTNSAPCQTTCARSYGICSKQ